MVGFVSSLSTNHLLSTDGCSFVCTFVAQTMCLQLM